MIPQPLRLLLPALALGLLLVISGVAAAESVHDSPFGFSLLIPDGWAEGQSTKGGRLTRLYLKASKSGHYLYVKVGKPDGTMQSGDALELIMKVYENQSPKRVEIKGSKDWVRMLTKVDADPETAKPATVEIVFVSFRNNRYYSFNGGAPASEQPTLEKELAKIMSSVAFRAPDEAAIARAEPPTLKPAPGTDATDGSKPGEAAGDPKPANPSPTPAPAETPRTTPGANGEPGAGLEPAPRKATELPDPPALDAPTTPAPGPQEAPKNGETPAPAKDPARAPGAGPKVTVNALDRKYGTRLFTVPQCFDRKRFSPEHLYDDDITTAWRSPANADLQMMSVVFALPTEVVATGVEVVNAQRSKQRSMSVRTLRFEAATQDPSGPWKPLGAAVEANPGGATAIALQGRPRVRWLRVVLLGNHGHPTLTQIHELRLWTLTPLEEVEEPDLGPGSAATPATTDKGTLSLEKARLSRRRNGPNDGRSYRAGERVHVCFRPRGLTLDKDGRFHLVVDLKVLGADDKVVVKKVGVVDHIARPPQPPLTNFVSLHMDLPGRFPAGLYKVVITGRDSLTGAERTQTLPLEVLPRREAGADSDSGGEKNGAAPPDAPETGANGTGDR